MPIASRSVDATSRQPLALRMRPDLAVQRTRFGQREQVVVKDPVALKYYRFDDEEFAILEMLDGRSSREDIQEAFQRRFAPQRIRLRELDRFLARAYRDALIVSDAPGQGAQLRARHDQRRAQRWRDALSSVLCVRFRGVDPDRCLAWLERRVGWLFAPAAFLVWLAGVLAALTLLAVEYDHFCARLPSFHQFFAAGNWLWLAVALAATKILHELGHGLACKRFGGECHEMGLMLLVLTPCLYCNVSDAWMVPSKWHRAAIGSAGMYVEMGLASLCTFLWWFTEPGLLHYLCLNVMFVCSVSTIVFNANPLLRYDGYYILSDLVEIPNLREKAAGVLRAWLIASFARSAQRPDRFGPVRRKWLLGVYAVAAAVYRWLVLLSIFWFLWYVFEPFGLRTVGQLLASAAIIGLVVRPIWLAAKSVCQPGAAERIAKPRLFFGIGGLSLLLAGALLVPLPHWVRCDVHVRPREAASVYVHVPGVVTAVSARPGQRVSRGQRLLSLENLDLRLEEQRLICQRDVLTTKLESLHQRSLRGDAAAALEIEPARKALSAVREQLARRRDDIAQLGIDAPGPGVVLAPPAVDRHEPSHELLPAWSGRPLEPANVGAYLTEGVLVCRIGDPQRVEAILAVEPSNMEWIRCGQPVTVVLDQSPAQTFRTTVEDISERSGPGAPNRGTTVSPRVAGRLRGAAHGRVEPSARYRARCPLDAPDDSLRLGGNGRATIFTGYQSLAERLVRYLARTFSISIV